MGKRARTCVNKQSWCVIVVFRARKDVLATIVFTCVFGETDRERRSEDFLLEEIFLVEEEDDGGVAEPLVVADGVKQF